MEIIYVLKIKVVFSFFVMNVVFKGNIVVMNLFVVINIRLRMDIIFDIILKNIVILYFIEVREFWRRFLLYVMVLLVRYNGQVVRYDSKLEIVMFIQQQFVFILRFEVLQIVFIISMFLIRVIKLIMVMVVVQKMEIVYWQIV